MSSATDLQHEMHRQMLLRGNLTAAVLIFIAATLVNCWLVPDPFIATTSFVMAAGLILLSLAGRRGSATTSSAGSLAILGLGLSAMYLNGVIHDHALDQALNGAMLLPIVAYACLVGSGWRWLAGVTAGALALEILAFLVHGPLHDHGLTVLAYSVLYTLGAAAVALLFSLAHRRVLDYAESEAAQARLRSRELQIAEARVRAVLDAIPNPIYAKDRELRYIDCNAAFCAVIGRPRERIVGCTVEEVQPEAESVIFHIKDLELLAHGGIQSFEMQLRYADGGERPVMFHKAVVRGADGSPAGLVGTFVDLSEQRQLHDRLIQAEKLEALGRLAGGVAHDMNNQLTGVLGYAELLAARLPDGPDRSDAYAIVTAASRAANLPRQLLAFARKGNYLAVPVQMHQLIHEVGTMLSRSIGPGIAIDLQLQAGSHTIVGDPGQLQSLLLNLALNARDAMPDGGRLTIRTAMARLPQPALGVVADDLPAGDYLHLEVIDTGQGMDEEVQRRLFEPFFTTKPAGSGTGLGLASVYGAVHNHHGGIGIRSAPGQGCAITVLLPLVPTPEPAAPAAAPATAVRQRLLVIDDEDIVRMVIAAQLQQMGHTPIPCGCGQEAVDRLTAGEQVDGAILDLLMPGMSGQETFHRLRALRPELQVVVASGHHDDQAAQALLDAGARAFIGKPMRLAQLIELFGRV